MPQLLTRRRLLKGAATLPAAWLVGGTARSVHAQSTPVRIGLLLPYTGTYAQLGHNITDAFKLRLAEANNQAGGRKIEIVVQDSEANPNLAIRNTRKLLDRDKVDFLVGPVHSGVALAMVREVAPRGRPILIIPNAGANEITREHCAPNVFRTSFSNWQAAYPAGTLLSDDGHKTMVTISWNYAAGQEMMDAGAAAFEAKGGKRIKALYLPFPDVDFQAHLTEIAGLKPDAVFAFFSGGGAVKFVQDYAAHGLKARIPLYGPGFLTEGVASAQGAAAEGIRTTLHYSDDLQVPANLRFRPAFRNATGREADVFAVQGYDAGSTVIAALEAVRGDTDAVADMIKGIEALRIESPRGPLSFAADHNPIQDFYVREVRGGHHITTGIAARALADPATGCAIKT